MGDRKSNLAPDIEARLSRLTLDDFKRAMGVGEQQPDPRDARIAELEARVAELARLRAERFRLARFIVVSTSGFELFDTREVSETLGLAREIATGGK